MSYDDIKSGAVVQYPYLWHWQAKNGESEGRKSRPTVVAVRISRQDRSDLLVLFPITTKEPDSHLFAVEVPEMEKRRAGLDVAIRQWIVLAEYNEDELPGSHYMEPDARIGEFSKAFLLPLLRQFSVRRSEARSVSRRS